MLGEVGVHGLREDVALVDALQPFVVTRPVGQADSMTALSVEHMQITALVHHDESVVER